MMNQGRVRIAWAVVSILIASATYGDAPSSVTPVPTKQIHKLQKPVKPKPLSLPHLAAPVIPKEEPSGATANLGFATTAPFAAAFSASPSASASPNATTLSPPATLTYSGSSNALTVTDSGTGRGISSTVTNTGSGSSALFGSTVGSGAGLTGYNGGTGGPGGKFEVTNANSAQAGMFATTNGTGSAILATVTNIAGGPAVLGQSIANASNITPNPAIGVEGTGNTIGVLGLVPNSSNTNANIAGLYGESDNQSASGNYGVYATSESGIGVGAYSNSNYGLFATSNSSDAIYALTTSGSNAIYAENDTSYYFTSAVYATIPHGYAVEGVATGENGTGVYGESTDGTGVYGVDNGSGVGVYGSSDSGLAGQFYGNVTISGTLTVGSTIYSSDKNLKSNVLPVDGTGLLDRIGHMDISSWTYKTDPTKRHIGPMAQDFHSAFGLNGEDDAHISQVDIAGVSLAAIQELHIEMQQKDAQIQQNNEQIAELKTQLAEQARSVHEMEASLTERMASLESRKDAHAQTVALSLK